MSPKSGVDYHPFGMVMGGRSWSQSDYRYGFNGMEGDDEVSGDGNSYDFGARMYDPRIGRWFATDPLEGKYPNMSPYTGIGNNPILYTDPNGREVIITIIDRGESKPKLVKIHVTAVIVDDHYSSFSLKQAEVIKGKMEAAIEKWNRNDIDGFEIEATSDITIFEDPAASGQVGRTEDYDNSNDRRSKVLITQLGKRTIASAAQSGSQMKVGSNVAGSSDEVTNANHIQTLSHEFGHWFGIIFHAKDYAFVGTFGGRTRVLSPTQALEMYNQVVQDAMSQAKAEGRELSEEEINSIELPYSLIPYNEQTKDDTKNLMYNSQINGGGYNLVPGQIEEMLNSSESEFRKKTEKGEPEKGG